MRVVPGIMVMAAMMGLASAAQAEVMSVGDDEGYCREYTQTLRIGGKLRQGYGTACLQPDGSWQLVSPAQTAAEDEVVFDAGAYEIGGEPVQYVVESPQVVMLPPAPVVWGDVWIGGDFGHRHHGRHGGRHWHR